MPGFNPDVRVTGLKREEGLEKSAMFKEGGEENQLEEIERGVSPEEVREGEPPGETGMEICYPKEPETS
ncbi:hypothetical protein NDU88_004287 [Pleurodeles waltl]|uniref:Uncharacterized protein n=1 Tax=Pleurodeles waltl TaxID=8319 RepID=A0AAV7MB98_PLEWA|nr:hypothetical protein NDU88_004287 [Pleurodeles waltl]